jgi:hypothetical protein
MNDRVFIVGRHRPSCHGHLRVSAAVADALSMTAARRRARGAMLGAFTRPAMSQLATGGSLVAAPASRSDQRVPLGWKARRLLRVATAPSVALRAFVVSRLIVLLAGVGGVLTVSTRANSFPGVADFLSGSTVRWDSFHYLAIASHGYAGAGAGSRAFLPLYPLLIDALGFLTGSDAIAGVAISVTSFAFALVLLHRLTELELGKRAADTTVLLVAFAPLSFFFSAVYTESLFLLLSVGSILAARRERWALAGILGGLATVTRVTGLLLFLPIVIMHLRSRREINRQLGWALLVPAALVAYLTSLAATGSSWLAPFQAEGVWHREAVGPITGVALALKAAIHGAGAIANGAPVMYDPARPSAMSVYLLLVLVIAAIFLVACFRRLPLEYGAYAAAALMVCVASPMHGQPLISLDRYVLTIFPLWMAAGAWVQRRRLTPIAVIVGALMLVFYTVAFSRGSFLA